MTTLLHSAMLNGKTLDELKQKYPKVHFKETVCEGLTESQPLIMRIPDCTFFGPVMPKRIKDVVVDNADDIKIQTSRLFDVEMEKYMSEPLYRQIVLQMRIQLEELEQFDSASILEAMKQFAETQKLTLQQVSYPLKIAVMKTTNGPAIEDILEAFGQDDAVKRIDSFLEYYKFRY